MKRIKEICLFYVRLISLSTGILLLLPTHPIQAEEIERAVFSQTLTSVPHRLEPSTIFFVTPHGDSISRTIDIGNTLRNNLLAFHTSIIIGFGAGDVKFKVSGNEDDEVLFGSFGTGMGTDEEGTAVVTSDFGYAESAGEYTLEFSTESFVTAIIVTAPFYPVGYWNAPVTLKMTVSME